MGRAAKTVAIPRREAKSYLGKAEQFLAEARVGLEAGRRDAAMLNAVHAAISATDAVTVGLGGKRSSDPDHQRAADLLEQVVGSSAESGKMVSSLRRLLAKKSIVEYESRRATLAEAVDAVKRAERIYGWARGVVERARL